MDKIEFIDKLKKSVELKNLLQNVQIFANADNSITLLQTYEFSMVSSTMATTIKTCFSEKGLEIVSVLVDGLLKKIEENYAIITSSNNSLDFEECLSNV